MKTKLFWSLGLLAFAFFPTKSASAAEPAITEKELVRRTQELFDAVVPGDQTPWKKYFADDCIYSDEKGRTLDKTALVADITPLPTGYSGTIKLAKVQSRIFETTAILNYDLEETETIFGQELHARYHQTDTWLLHAGAWQIVAAQAMRYYEDPALGRADAKKIPAYLGQYSLGPERRATITTENGALFMERTGGKKTELFPEAGDIFFRKGVEGRILFHFDAEGKIDFLIDRRNNEDVVWRKTQ